MKGSLSNSELSMVSEVIATRMGLHFPIKRWAMLSHNLASAASEFGFINMNEFIQWLLISPLNKEQMEVLAAHLTISETYFWREPQVFTALTDFILPELINSKKKREKSIKIWSAGCSTGEEPYSIAIALYKTIPKIKDWDITILATDINEKALIKARTGIYNSWSFRNSPPWLKGIYFQNGHDRKYEIIPEIKRMVTFSCCSLTADDTHTSFRNNDIMDIIFCRNVLMYFTPEWASKITRNFSSSLSENGWFIVSSCELSMQLFPKFSPVNYPGAILYRKTKTEAASSPKIPFDDIQKTIKQPSQTSQPIQPVQPLKSASIHFKPFKQTESVSNTTEVSYTDMILAIRLLADKCHLAEALSACEKAIALNKLVPGLYLLRASILQELDRGHEAIKSLKQAIYIDPNYIMGHFTLGNLFFHQGNIKDAKRYFNNALELLNTSLNDDIPAESEGLSVQYIREIILTSLKTQNTI